jgi:MerR family transcriptional regulator/heat shock protein HspR
MRQAQGIYMISVVAETLDMHPQTLRKYERAGFVYPLRMGSLRTYSDSDIARLRLIKHFVEDLGLNLAGVELALGMATKLLSLRAQLTSQRNPSAATTQSVSQIDEMLKDLKLEVLPSTKSQGNPPDSPPTEDGWFQVAASEEI